MKNLLLILSIISGVSLAAPCTSPNGCTGKNNPANTTMGWESNVAFKGAYNLNMRLTESTSITLPASGRLVTESGSYANPDWITSLDASKISNIGSSSGVVFAAGSGISSSNNWTYDGDAGINLFSNTAFNNQFGIYNSNTAIDGGVLLDLFRATTNGTSVIRYGQYLTGSLWLTGLLSGDAAFHFYNWQTSSDAAVINADNTVTISNLSPSQLVYNNASGKLQSGDLTGDISSSGGLNTTLATVNSTPGTVGSTSQVPVITANGKGLVTAESQVNIQIAESQVTNLTTDLAGKADTNGSNATGTWPISISGTSAGAPPTGAAGGVLNGSYPNPTLATVNSNTTSTGSSNQTLVVTANSGGQVTSLAAQAIQIAESQVTDLVTDLASKQSTTLNNGQILVGNGSNVATGVTPSGDVTISNTGVTAIGASKVTNAMLAGSIDDTKLNTISTAGKVSNSATTATSSNTNSAIVARDGSGNTTVNTLFNSISGTPRGSVGPNGFNTDMTLQGVTTGSWLRLGAANARIAFWTDGNVNANNSPNAYIESSVMNAVNFNASALTANSPVFSDGSKNLTSSGTVPVANGGTNSTSQTSSGLAYYNGSAIATNANFIYDGSNTVTLSNTGANSIIVKSTTTGSNNSAGFFASRGDVANGYAFMLLQNGSTNVWNIGLRPGNNGIHFYNDLDTAERMQLTQAGELLINNATSYAGAKIAEINGVAGTPSFGLALLSPRSYAPANDGTSIIFGASNGAAGTHDYGAIFGGTNPVTSDGGAGLMRFKVGGASSVESSAGVFLQASSTGTGGATSVSLMSGGANTVALNVDNSQNVTIPNGDLIMSIAGKTLSVKTGTNACAGVGITLSAGTATVNTSCAVTGRIILLTETAQSGTPGVLRYSIASGTSFTVDSSSVTDASTFNWVILKTN